MEERSDNRKGDYAKRSEERARLVEEKMRPKREKARLAERFRRFEVPVHGEDPEALDAAWRKLILRCLESNEIGDAELFVFCNDEKFLHALPSRRWFRWAGHRWAPDDREDHAAGIEAVIDRYREAAMALTRERNAPDTDEDRKRKIARQRRALERRIFQLQSARRRRAVLSLATAGAPITLSVTDDDLDQNTSLIAFKNGVFDLKSFLFRPGRPEDRITRGILYDYEPDATAPRWERALREIFNDDTEKIAFFQRFCGYALLGRPVERKMLLLLGAGSNGKSLLIRVLQETLGDMAGSLPASILVQRRDAGGPSPELAAVKDLRVGFVSEPPTSQRLDAERVKLLTGGADKITARPLYGTPITFENRCVFFVALNALPPARGEDLALWARFLALKFNTTFLASGQAEETALAATAGRILPADPDLPRKLLQERQGILNWCIRGVAEYREKGLAPPGAARGVTEELREEHDIVGVFAQEKLLFNPEYVSASSLLYEAYRAWAEDSGGRVMSHAVFGRRFHQRFPNLTRQKSHGSWVYEGVGVK